MKTDKPQEAVNFKKRLLGSQCIPCCAIKLQMLITNSQRNEENSFLNEFKQYNYKCLAINFLK